MVRFLVLFIPILFGFFRHVAGIRAAIAERGRERGKERGRKRYGEEEGLSDGGERIKERDRWRGREMA